MRKFLFIFFFIIIQTNCLAQEIIWAKQFLKGGPFFTATQLTSLIQKKDSSFISVGEFEHFGVLLPIVLEFYPGVGLVFLNKSGDTIKFINLNTFGRNPRVVLGLYNEIYVGASVQYDTVINSKLRVFKLDSLGNILWARYLTGPTYNRGKITRILSTPDGGCLVVGHVAGQLYWSDWLVMKYSYNGDLEWSQRFNGGGTSEANHIEPMPGGNYLVSGMVGNKIWALVIDANGQMLSNSDYFFHTSPNPYLFRAAWIVQSPGKKFFASCNQYIGLDSLTSFIGRFDSNKVKEWGSYKPVGGLMPWATSDGGYNR